MHGVQDQVQGDKVEHFMNIFDVLLVVGKQVRHSVFITLDRHYDHEHEKESEDDVGDRMFLGQTNIARADVFPDTSRSRELDAQRDHVAKTDNVDDGDLGG